MDYSFYSHSYESVWMTHSKYTCYSYDIAHVWPTIHGGGAHCDMIISVTQNMTKLHYHLIDGLSKNHVFTDMRELGSGS